MEHHGLLTEYVLTQMSCLAKIINPKGNVLLKILCNTTGLSDWRKRRRYYISIQIKGFLLFKDKLLTANMFRTFKFLYVFTLSTKKQIVFVTTSTTTCTILYLIYFSYFLKCSNNWNTYFISYIKSNSLKIKRNIQISY